MSNPTKADQTAANQTTDTGITALWYKGSFWLLLLYPLSVVFKLVAFIRKKNLQKKSCKAQAPVIVVGNITVGGTGKTPVVIALANHFAEQGKSVAIISRGYGGTAKQLPYFVTATDNPSHCGDEPLLMAQNTTAQVVIDADRCRAIEALQKQHKPDVILLDDGLQHYRLARDIEIVVVDGKRGFGNGWCLPAGPLREPINRLNSIDFVISNGACSDKRLPSNTHTFTLSDSGFYSLIDKQQTTLTPQTIHAVAGIGNPSRFFNQLTAQGFTVIEHAFADHHAYSAQDISWSDAPVVMTEKDAVKCQQFAQQHWYYVPVKAQLPDMFLQQLDAKLTTFI